MREFRNLAGSLFLVLILQALCTEPVHAGVFNLPQFTQPGHSVLGLEPEFIMTNGAGVGINARYAYGLTNLNNLHAIVGTGSGPRRFRLGGAMTFDFFPDLEGQPGIGVAVQGIYYRLANYGQLELTGIPYIHKTFVNGDTGVEPFVGVPLGIGFHEGKYEVLALLSIGASFQQTETLKYIVELGVAINHTDSYLSGGISFNL